MGESTRSMNLSAWGLLLLGVLGFAAMVVLMIRSTGDYPFQATADVTVHAGPDTAEAVVETLAAGAVLMCHQRREAHPEWLNCSDIIEKKYVRAETMQSISEAEYREAKKNQPAAARP